MHHPSSTAARPRCLDGCSPSYAPPVRTAGAPFDHAPWPTCTYCPVLTRRLGSALRRGESHPCHPFHYHITASCVWLSLIQLGRRGVFSLRKPTSGPLLPRRLPVRPVRGPQPVPLPLSPLFSGRWRVECFDLVLMTCPRKLEPRDHVPLQNGTSELAALRCKQPLRSTPRYRPFSSFHSSPFALNCLNY